MRLNREKYKGVKITKNIIQDEGLTYWKNNNCFGALAMATGAGKSRCGVLAARYSIDAFLITPTPKREPKVLLVVPTEVLRDTNWAEEFEEWKEKEIWDNYLTRCCYVSLNKYKDEDWDLIILDEAHHITPSSAEFFKNNKVARIISLTATPPEDREKKALLKDLSPVVFIYPLEEAEEDGIVAPFDIICIKTYLDSKTKNIEAGNAKKRWFQTEYDKYWYVSGNLDKLRVQKEETLKSFNIERAEASRYRIMLKDIKDNKMTTGELERYYQRQEERDKLKKYIDTEDSYEARIMSQISSRSQLLYNLPSKTALAERVLAKMKKDFRTIVFCGSIKQANYLCGDCVFHSQSDTSKMIKDKTRAYDYFKSCDIDLLGVCKALNEGHNIPMVDQGIVVQINSKELDFIQRLGRLIRYRDNHRGRIIILVVMGTKDEDWFKSALKSFNQDRIKYLDAKLFD